MSPRSIWKPFELFEQEYQEILLKLLDPDWVVLCKKLWRIRLHIQFDSAFDHIDDRYTWMELVSGKHGVNSLEEAQEEIEHFKKSILETNN